MTAEATSHISFVCFFFKSMILESLTVLVQQAQSHLVEQDMAEIQRSSYAASTSPLPSLTYSSAATPSTTCSFPYFSAHQSRALDLPQFIKPTPPRIPTEDLEFLSKKGALQLPEETLRNELLKAYFKFVHPFMPLLDRKEFMEITMGVDTTRKKIGLLLFQAVMFAGSAVSIDIASFTSSLLVKLTDYSNSLLTWTFCGQQAIPPGKLLEKLSSRKQGYASTLIHF